MNFKKLLPTGFAVAVGLMMTVSGAKAQTTLTYTSQIDSPTLEVAIDDAAAGMSKYTIKLSSLSGTGTIDFLAFAFDWGFQPTDPTDDTNRLELSDFAITSALTPTESGGLQPITDPSPIPTQLFFDTADCLQGCNFNGDVVEDPDGPGTEYDYIYKIGDRGAIEVGDAAGLGGIDEVTFTIMAPVVPNLSPVDGFNPFTNIALRGQSYLTSDQLPGNDVSLDLLTNDEGEPVDLVGNVLTNEDEFIYVNSDSIKINFGDPLCSGPSCGLANPPDNQVPEIDGPVLIQVGFALGGLYLLLLGRRREEDELAHAA